MAHQRGLESNKIKVLFVTASTKGGGAERILINIINSLANNPQYLLRLINTSSQLIPNELAHSVSSICYNKENSRSAFKILFKDIKANKPDYVITTSSTIGYMLVMLKFIFRRTFKVYIRVAVPPSESVLKGIKSKILSALSKITYRNADLIIAQTEFMKKDLQKQYYLSGNNIMVIRNIVDDRYLNVASTEFLPEEFEPINYNIVAAGALYSVKGFDLLIKSFTAVINDIPNAKLFILGEERYEIGYKFFLEELINKNNLSNHIFLLGHKKNPYPYYKNANLFVMSSRNEGFPNVVLEALFCKTPVVASNCVDFTNVITLGSNGFVINKNSSEELASGIKLAYKKLQKPLNCKPIPNFDYTTIFT